MQLSDRAKELIPKSRIVSFATWSYPSNIIAIYQEADNQGLYLTDTQLREVGSTTQDISNILRDNADSIVAAAREKVMNTYPDIIQPGGELYPPERAKACWRDFWHFLRCISYGVAGDMIPFTSEEGLANMRLLYEELRVPLKAMVLGLEYLKVESLSLFPPDTQARITPHFDHLITAMKGFESYGY